VQGALALAVVLASQGTAALRGEAAPPWRPDAWARYFDDALASGALDELLPAPTAPLEARRLSGLVGSAWAFGGMGSWNDVAEDEAGLYDALVVAQVAAVNA
jgi:hypothetical protein